MIAMVSCKKEKQGQMLNNNELVVLQVDNMDEYLMAFKKKLLSAEKGGETISIKQAERDLGNLLNFDFGDANYASDDVRYDLCTTSPYRIRCGYGSACQNLQYGFHEYS